MRISEIISGVESDNNGELIEVPLDSDPHALTKEGDHVIYIWAEIKYDEIGRTYLTEVKGNTNLHVIAKYYYRYDPPRTASTGSGQVPQGDHHLFNNGVEIAAWNDAGKARHGFEPGTKIPNKALNHLQQKFGGVSLPPDGVLEQLIKGVAQGKLLLEVELT